MADTITVEDNGHSFVVAKSGPGAQMRIIRLIGAETAKNDSYVSMATLCYSVESIDGIPVPRPATPEQFEKLADRIGDSIQKVAEAFKTLNSSSVTEEEGTEIAKN